MVSLSVSEIEEAVDALPASERENLIRRLADRLKPGPRDDDLPVVPATGRTITQEELDDARDAD